MFRWFDSSPMLFTQPLQIENRQGFRRFKRIAEKMSNLLSDRSVLALRSCLELPVERIGKVFYIQHCHHVTPKLLHNGGTISDVSIALFVPKNFLKTCDHLDPAFLPLLTQLSFYSRCDLKLVNEEGLSWIQEPVCRAYPKTLTRPHFHL